MSTHSKKILLAILCMLIAGFLAFAFYMTWPLAFLPHHKIVIQVPWELNNPPIALNPMGETINHPDGGHPGIDFYWPKPTAIIASADGLVVEKTRGSSTEGKWDVYVKNGPYSLNYKELDRVNPYIHLLSRVHQGQIIGYLDGINSFHWEFQSMSHLFEHDRWCPMTYFDKASRQSIEAVWGKQSPDADGGMKRQFPDICSVQFKGREEKHHIGNLVFP